MLTETQLEPLRFPIGRWQKPAVVTPSERAAMVATLAAFPQRLRARLAGATDAQLDTPYRPEGWTVRQVVHHCADSHINCLIRIKLSLTEDQPAIKPYAEERWAELPDYRLPVEASLQLLDSVHARIVHVLSHVQVADWARTYVHPQYGTAFSLDQVLSLYAWHCDHHFGHVGLVLPMANA
jgi:hypothetical protein